MLLRPDPEDLRVISYYLGRVLLVMAAVAVLPLAWAVIGREWAPAASFVLTVGAFALVGVLVSVGGRRARTASAWATAWWWWLSPGSSLRRWGPSPGPLRPLRQLPRRLLRCHERR